MTIRAIAAAVLAIAVTPPAAARAACEFRKLGELSVDPREAPAVDIVVKAMLELRKRGASLLLVEQRIDVATRVCDRLYVMAHGEIVEEMTPEIVRSGGMSILNKYLG